MAALNLLDPVLTFQELPTPTSALIDEIFVRALPTRSNEERVMGLLENFGVFEASDLVRESRGGSRKVWLID